MPSGKFDQHFCGDPWLRFLQVVMLHGVTDDVVKFDIGLVHISDQLPILIHHGIRHPVI